MTANTPPEVWDALAELATQGGRPVANHAGILASLGCPVFACTPDQFPELMAVALKRQDIWGWAAERDIKLVRPP